MTSDEVLALRKELEPATALKLLSGMALQGVEFTPEAADTVLSIAKEVSRLPFGKLIAAVEQFQAACGQAGFSVQRWKDALLVFRQRCKELGIDDKFDWKEDDDTRKQ